MAEPRYQNDYFIVQFLTVQSAENELTVQEYLIMDKLSAIITFINVADTGSFTKAAERMNLPKARVSQRIKELEAELSVRLFERSTRTVRITAAGDEYLKECRGLLSGLSRVEENLKGGRNAVSGKLTIDVLSPFSRWVITPFINEFILRYPDIRLNIKSSDSLVNIIQQNVDLVIRGGALEDSSLIVRPLCQIPFQLYASPWVARNLSGKKKLTDGDDQQLISWFPDDEAELRWTLFSRSETQEIRSNSHMFISDQDMALQIAATSRRICPGMYLAADGFVKKGLLVPVLSEWTLAPKQVSILYPSKAHLPRKVEVFIDWMMETAGRMDFSSSHLPLLD